MGASFRICLPRASNPVEQPTPARDPLCPGARHETILLVEDETVVRQLVAEILETSGYTVLQAGTARRRSSCFAGTAIRSTCC